MRERESERNRATAPASSNAVRNLSITTPLENVAYFSSTPCYANVSLIQPWRHPSIHRRSLHSRLFKTIVWTSPRPLRSTPHTFALHGVGPFCSLLFTVETCWLQTTAFRRCLGRLTSKHSFQIEITAHVSNSRALAERRSDPAPFCSVSCLLHTQ